MGANFKMLRQVQQMQAKLADAQKELESAEVTAAAGGGAVSVVANGQQSLVSITIAPEVVDPADVDMLQDLVLAAVNEALQRSREMASEKMGALAGGLGLPPGLV